MVNQRPDLSGYTASQLITHLRSQGLSAREIAGELDRDPSIVYQVGAGKKSGAAYERTLRELAEQGQVTYRPPRRRRKDGTVSKVRGKQGQQAQAPPPPKPPPKRGKFGTETKYMPDGARMHTTETPRTEGKGRWQARGALMDQLRSAAKGRRRVTFVVTMSDGRQVELGRKGGYRSSDALQRSRNYGNGDDPLGWLGDEAQAVYAEIDGKIVNVSVRAWGRQTPETGYTHYGHASHP